MQLKDKIALVTGGATGLGNAVAIRFAREGATTIIADINAAAAHAAAEAIRVAGGQAEGVALDVTLRENVLATMEKVVEQHGRVDILVNNAGVTHYRSFLDATGDDWDRVLDVDLKGVFFCAQAVAPHMVRQKYGKIVNISSSLGTGASPHATAGSPGGSAAYGSAKAGVILLTKTLARELGPHGINVNCVAPGTFLTRILSATRSPGELEDHLEHRRKTNVLGRIGEMWELAAAVLFLASDESGFITGHTLNVDGGRVDRM